MKKILLITTVSLVFIFLLSFISYFSTDFNKSINFLKKNIPLPIKIYLKENFLKINWKNKMLNLRKKYLI